MIFGVRIDEVRKKSRARQHYLARRVNYVRRAVARVNEKAQAFKPALFIFGINVAASCCRMCNVAFLI